MQDHPPETSREELESSPPASDPESSTGGGASASATDRPQEVEPTSSRRFLALWVLPTMILLLFVVWPLVTGADTLFFRDVFNTHLEMKWWQAEAMRDGYMPLVDPHRSGGQAHLGNPNTVALYPDNVLFLVAPLFWALNAHFWLHLLLAPFGAFWLARRLGLARPAAWSAGVFYASSGYFLSTLNLYNLVAGAALIPAFLAAVLALCAEPRRRGRLAALAALWCLLVLAGDPMTAALALVMSASLAWIVRPRRAEIVRVGVALGLGSLLSAPLVVEFLRIVGLTFRGYQGYSAAGATVASWHPAAALEWLVPFAFGEPDLAFWGQRFYSGSQPLFYSFHPGWLALACVGVGVVAVENRRRTRSWALGLIALGLFLALGGHNPVVSWLLGLPGLSVLRLPVKFWPLVAVPAAVLAAIGFERLLSGGGARRLRRAAIALGAAYALLFLSVVVLRGPLQALLTGWMPPGFAAASVPTREVARWSSLLLQSVGLSILFFLVTFLGRRSFRALLPVLLVTHLILQLALLAPLYRSEETRLYLAAPPPVAAIPAGALVAHGAAGDLFGSVPVPVAEYPSLDPRWMQRQLHGESHPYAGIMAGLRYEFALSPEGLDAFLTRAATEAFRVLNDGGRIRMLEASGVRWLFMKRPLQTGDRLRFVERHESLGGDLLLYQLPGAAEPVQFVGELLPSANLNEALNVILSPTFDPRSHAVVAATERYGSGLTGRVTALDNAAPESWSWTVEAAGAGALLIQRAHLPIYRLEVDGRRVEPLVANLHRMAVPLDAGSHVVELSVDRSPFRAASAVSMLTALALLLYVLSSRRVRPTRS